VQDKRFDHLPRSWRGCVHAFLQANRSASSRHVHAAKLACFFSNFCYTTPNEVDDETIAAFLAAPSHARQSLGEQIEQSTADRRRQVLTAFYLFASTYQVRGRPLYRRPLPRLLDPKKGDDVSGPDKKSPFAHLSPEWQKCIGMFLDQVEGISGSTDSRKDYRQNLASFFSVPGKSCDAYTRTEVIEWLNAPSRSRRNLGAPIGAAGYNGRLKALNSFFKWAAGYCEGDGEPLMSRKPPTLGVKYRRVGARCRALSERELERLFAVIAEGEDEIKSARDFALYCTYFYTGRRRRELVNLKWGDISEATFFENGVARAGIMYEFTSKGKSREQQRAELPRPAWDAIQHYLRVSGRLETMQPDDVIFTSVLIGRPRIDGQNSHLNPSYVNTMFLQYCKKAGIDTSRGITLHSMRHTAAMSRLLAGCELESIRRFLGHSSIATTARYLITVQTPSDSDAARLEKRLPFLSQPGGVAR
jgi:integrase